MPELTQSVPPNDLSPEAVSSLDLAQQLAQQLAIGHKDWHRLQSNRPARAQEQAAIAMVYLLKGESALALAHLQQATAWLDRSVSAPPCPH
ncbi:MAG: hypothetical protein H7237_02725 [Alkalinema sp. FL-bin-369]|nr:hypothetical protein [Leptolyngbyaceae cyanobacterium LF-bin-369]